MRKRHLIGGFALAGVAGLMLPRPLVKTRSPLRSMVAVPFVSGIPEA